MTAYGYQHACEAALEHGRFPATSRRAGVRRLNPPTCLDLEAGKRFARLSPWNARFGVNIVGSYRLVVLAW